MGYHTPKFMPNPTSFTRTKSYSYFTGIINQLSSEGWS